MLNVLQCRFATEILRFVTDIIVFFCFVLEYVIMVSWAPGIISEHEGSCMVQTKKDNLRIKVVNWDHCKKHWRCRNYSYTQSFSFSFLTEECSMRGTYDMGHFWVGNVWDSGLQEMQQNQNKQAKPLTLSLQCWPSFLKTPFGSLLTPHPHWLPALNI